MIQDHICEYDPNLRPTLPLGLRSHAHVLFMTNPPCFQHKITKYAHKTCKFSQVSAFARPSPGAGMFQGPQIVTIRSPGSHPSARDAF